MVSDRSFRAFLFYTSMKKILALLFSVLFLFSCNQNTKFRISGTVKDAEGKKVYLIHDDLINPMVVDSAKLGADGEFSFSAKRPDYPDFYKLQLGTDKFITFSVDSCEDIQVETQDKNFSTAYKVTGSPASTNIQMLRKSLINIQLQIDKLGSLSGAAHAAKLNEITAAIEKHKQMAKGFIMANPGSTVAYFAIYQQINGTLLFSPYAKEDAPYYKAVATSYNTYMPEYVRTKNLYSLVMDAIKTERSNNARREWKEIVDKAGKGYIDITLKDKKDVEHKLSDLDGKVVLLDFTSYQAEGAVDYVFALRELYNKYHSRGFEIYQVSVDQNKVLWQQSVENIPWVCVRDDNGPNAVCLSTYNVTSIPTTFLLTRSGNIIKRSPGFDELKKLIEANL